MGMRVHFLKAHLAKQKMALAETAVKVSKTAISRKVNGKSYFSAPEIAGIAKTLDLNGNECLDIFLTN